MDYENERFFEVFEDTGCIHIDHCARCHLAVCPFEQGFGCSIRECPQCGTKMHGCKVEEHIQEICPKTQIPCINAGNGCARILRRFRLHFHLQTCPANIVVCTREWARKTVSNESKLKLKGTAKGVFPWEGIDIPLDQLDLAAAHSDQKVLFDSYTFRRKYRVRQRDRTHRDHPLVPLRTIYDMEGQILLPGGHDLDGDSSEEEREARAAQMRNKKAMFANCFMCQVDPASQHLHTLGSESVKFKLGRPVKKWPKQEDKFHSAHQLMIDFSTVTTSEERHLLFRKTLYIRRCLRVFHRREIGEHELSQHQTGLDNLGELVVRCPNWERGCGFFTARLRPLDGKLRFQRELDSVVHCPRPEDRPTSSASLDNQPDWLIEKLAGYLPSSALYSLSLTSKKLREILMEVATSQQLVEMKWRKTAEGWIEDGFKCFFSTGDRSAKLQWQPAVGLSDHLAICEHGEKKRLQSQRVLVLIEA